MKILAFMSVGNFGFSENIGSIKGFQDVDEVSKDELDKKYPSLYVRSLDFFIVFTEDASDEEGLAFCD